MKRSFRLNRRADFERVRRLGKSTAHPLIVLVSLPNDLAITRIGVSAGRAVGGAVQRNRAKRRMRAIIQRLLPEIQTGFDLIFVGRKPILNSSPMELDAAIRQLITRKQLFVDPEL